MRGITRLTPVMTGSFGGRVHSVFVHSVNLMFQISHNISRIVTLVPADFPKVPDSIEVPSVLLEQTAPGLPVRMTGSELMINGIELELVPDKIWTGRIKTYNRIPDEQDLTEYSMECACGFDLLPSGRREDAAAALLMANAPDWIGLGAGLTPSYDDALVGVMAVYRAAGLPLPFETKRFRYNQTTDISARYLRLATEGYFGEPLLNLIEAIYGHGNLYKSVCQIRQVGATSGCDMLFGVIQAIHLLKKGI